MSGTELGLFYMYHFIPHSSPYGIGINKPVLWQKKLVQRIFQEHIARN